MRHLSLLMVLIAVLAILVMAGCPEPQDTGAAGTGPEPGRADMPEPVADTPAEIPANTTDDTKEVTVEMITTDSGLQYEDLVVGDGAEATAGANVYVHYTGWLEDGTKFDSSVDRGQKFDFPLGGGKVIRGWDEGVQGMKVGGKRKLIIPPDLGYGPGGFPPVIPPNATLTFEVELFEVQ